MVSFTKSFKLDKVSLIFALISFALGDWLKIILLQFMSENILFMFSFKSFMVSCLIFWSLNYFKFILVYGMREYSNFFDLHKPVQLSQHYLLKVYLFSMVYSCLIYQRLIVHRSVGLCWGSLSVSSIHIPIFVPIPHSFD